MKTYIIIGILVILFIYMVVWSLKLYFYNKRQQKVKRIQELREKGNKVIQPQEKDNKDYWYNQREIVACGEDEDTEKLYHYFDSVEEGTKGLLLEMYDCGIVRTDELEQISFGKSRFQNMDLSFLEELEKEILEPEAKAEDNVSDDALSQGLNDIIQVDGLMGGFFSKSTPDVVTAAKELKEDDPGITDIHGTLSEGVENVIAAVDAEKAEEEKKNEPIVVKEEKSVEEARKARELTANAEIRSKVYDKWTGYVEELFSIVVIHAEDDIKNKLRKALMDYGYNDVDVLLESPDDM